MPTSELPHISISEATRVRLPLVMLLALIGFVAAAAAVWNGQSGALAEHARTLQVHDSRIKAIEEQQVAIRVMQNDVEWIRRTIEKQAMPEHE